MGIWDAPLSEAGLADCRKTADYFRGQHIDTLYASSLGRAMRTAEIIGKAIQLDPIPVDKLRERYYGRLEGKRLDRFEPDGSGPWYFRPYVNLTLYFTGEHEKDFIARVIEEHTGNHRAPSQPAYHAGGALGYPGHPVTVFSRFGCECMARDWALDGLRYQ